MWSGGPPGNVQFEERWADLGGEDLATALRQSSGALRLTIKRVSENVS